MSFLPSFLSTYALQKDMIRFLEKSKSWSLQHWKSYQFEKLQELLNHCKDNVPYYKKIFTKYNIKIDDITSLDMLNKLPFLSRNLVRKNLGDLKAKNYPNKSFQIMRTSGTTEKPLEYYVEKKVWLSNHLAFNRVFMNQAGYKRGDRIVSFLGINEKMKKHVLLNTLELSSKHLINSFHEFLKKIEEYQPKYIVSYPSAIYFLAKYISDNQKEISFELDAVFCHGEPVFTWQRSAIEKVFSCQILDIYGNGEKNVLSATSIDSTLHHIFPNFCIVELIDSKGNKVQDEGRNGEIVTTGLLSPIFPFIRYKTGDIATYTSQSFSGLRNYPLLKKIIGRIQDFVLSKKDNIISSADINKVIANHGAGLSAWQFIQFQKGKLVLQIMLYQEYKKNESKIMTNLDRVFEQIYPNEFDLSIELVNEFHHQGSRKHAFLIQQLSLEKYYSKILPC